MSSKRRGRSRGRGGGNRKPTLISALFLVAGLMVLGLVLSGDEEAQARHPAPRSDVSARQVAPAARYSSAPRIASVYRIAARVPSVLDGLYCYCHCARHAGHRSLLTCFETDHGAGCGTCLEEASMAYRLTQDGKDLQEVRRAVDRAFR